MDTTLYAPATPFFVEALDGLGWEYRFVDEGVFLRPLERSLPHKIGYRLLRRRPLTYWAFNRRLHDEARRFRPDLLLAVKGGYIMPATLQRIKRDTGATLVNYATDDPFNAAVATPDLLPGIPCYDLYACTKRAIVDDVRRAGCPRAIYTRFAYKPSVHFPEAPATPEERTRFHSDVVLVGTAEPDRVRFVEAVAALPGIVLALYGGYWARHPALHRFAQGHALGREYRFALGGTKIALDPVRRANRDDHAMRSFEIPACGAFLLAERTPEHQAMFTEGADAAFFDSPADLAAKVRYYLDHDSERRRIAEAGRRRVVTGGNTYRDRLVEIVQAVQRATPPSLSGTR